MNAAVIACLALSALAQAPVPAPAPNAVIVKESVLVKQAEAEQAATRAVQKAADSQAAKPSDSTPAVEESQSGGPGVLTIREEWISAMVAAVEDGKLVLATEPPQKIAFDEIARIDLAGAAASGTLAVEWLGQDNRDLVGPVSSGGGNGIQDVHVRLRGLALGEEIKQIVAVRRKPSPLRVWRMDTSRSPHWKIGVRRGKGSGTADLFLEPTGADFFEHELTLTVTYQGGKRTKVNVAATTHTDHQLKVADAPAASPAENAIAAGPAVTVHLEGGDLLHGNLSELTEDYATLRTFWEQDVQLPLLEVLAIRFDEVKSDAGQSSFEGRLANPTGDDTALVLSRDKSAAEVAGSCRALAGGKLQFRFDEEDRAINLDRLIGLVFAAHPPVRAGAAMRQVVQLVNGDRISGVLAAVSDDSLELQMASGQTVAMPRNAAKRITFVNGRMVYLSDVEPLSVDEVPYFGRTWPFRRDAGLEGGTLVMDGTPFKKGLAVHSRCVLRYALDGQYELFKTRVGFDDSAGRRGAVVCRVLADGRQLFVEPDLRADAAPIDIEVPVTGATELTLEIDFGQREDTGDRIIWAAARILRAGDSAER